MTNSLKTLAVGVAAAALMIAQPSTGAETGVKNIVLVHGAWADGSGWQGVYSILKDRGYNVSIVQNPLTTLEADVAATDRVLARQDGPVILVGHSYAGMVITEAGDDAKVAGLVYVSAFAPDVGESVFSIIEGSPPPPVETTDDGFLFLNKGAFLAAFAPDLAPDVADFLAETQIPPSVAAYSAAITVAPWKTKPSWFVVSADDQIIPAPAQRQMAARAGSTVVDVAGSHVLFMAKPEVVADTIETAAKSVGLVAN